MKNKNALNSYSANYNYQNSINMQLNVKRSSLLSVVNTKKNWLNKYASYFGFNYIPNNLN